MPALADPVTTSQLSSVQIRVGNALPTRDLFPSYTMSPEYFFYARQPHQSRRMCRIPRSISSPGSQWTGSWRGMGLLLDCSSDLPMLPLPLLPLPTSSASVSVAAPLVLDSLPGCQYQMTSYDNADVTDVDPAYGLQLHHPRFLEYVRAPELAHLLKLPSGVLASPYGPGGGYVGCPPAAA